MLGGRRLAAKQSLVGLLVVPELSHSPCHLRLDFLQPFGGLVGQTTVSDVRQLGVARALKECRIEIINAFVIHPAIRGRAESSEAVLGQVNDQFLKLGHVRVVPDD